MRKTSKELSVIALQAIVSMEVLVSELEEMEGTTMAKGRLKQKINVLRRELDKQQELHLPSLFAVDEKLILRLMKDKQELTRHIACMEYTDQLEVLHFIEERNRIRENLKQGDNE